MVLPGAINAQILFCIPFFAKTGIQQNPGRRFIIRNTACFDTMKVEIIKGKPDHAFHGAGHTPLPTPALAHPISERAHLRDTATDIGEIDTANHFAFIFLDQEHHRAALIAERTARITHHHTITVLIKRIVCPDRLIWLQKGMVLCACAAPVQIITPRRKTQQKVCTLNLELNDIVAEQAPQHETPRLARPAYTLADIFANLAEVGFQTVELFIACEE